MECIICENNNAQLWYCSNTKHKICNHCINTYLQTLVDDNCISETIKSPCRCEDSDLSNILIENPLLQKLKRNYMLSKKKTHAFSTKKDVINYINNEVLIYHCPNCAISFIDFDGCAALVCRGCYINFCAYCFQKSDGSLNCHDHIRTCKYNIHNTYSYYTRNKTSLIHEPYRMSKIIEIIGENVHFIQLIDRYIHYFKNFDSIQYLFEGMKNFNKIKQRIIYVRKQKHRKNLQNDSNRRVNELMAKIKRHKEAKIKKREQKMKHKAALKRADHIHGLMNNLTAAGILCIFLLIILFMN